MRVTQWFRQCLPLPESKITPWPVLLWLFVISLIGGIYTASVQIESNDSFCASCHAEPETRYYKESLQEQPSTLAAFHAGAGTRCIDCHSRRWIFGRLWAQWGGLLNLIAYWSNDYELPNVTTRPVGDSGCTKCHSELTWVSERPGHYHSPRLRRSWRNTGGPVNTCEVCHPSHLAVPIPNDGFIDDIDLESQCDACHEALNPS